jgi:hypothetical protein
MTGTLFVAINPGSTGTYNLDAGTLDITGDIVNNGTITQAPAATLNLGGTVIGNGIIHVNGPLALADQTNVNTGTVGIEGGNATATNVVVGLDAQDPDTHANIPGNGNLSISGGTTTVTGVLGAGNSGSLTSGVGTGTIDASGGTLNVGTVMLGSTAGGIGNMRLHGTCQVVIGGGLSANDLTVDDGTLTLLDQAPPSGEDPVLDRSIVGGYLRDGGIFVSGGTTTSPRIKLGITSGKTGSFTMTGGTVNVGVLGAGNDATLTGGQGNGQIAISGGTLNAKTVILGSTVGGTGTMTLSIHAQVVIGGGLTMNDLIMNGGSLTVLDQAPPAGEDPVLDRSIVGGYLRDGAMTMNAGTVSTVNLKVGVTPGKVGTLTLNGGSITTTNLLAPNGAGSVIVWNGGALTSGHSVVDGASALVVGNGTSPARFALSPAGGSHSFADGLSISAVAHLAGGASRRRRRDKRRRLERRRREPRRRDGRHRRADDRRQLHADLRRHVADGGRQPIELRCHAR